MQTEVTTEIERPRCPECGTVMGKGNKPWCGRHRKQLWRCSKCGRTKLLPLDGNGHSSESIANTATVTKPKPVPRKFTMPVAGKEETYRFQDKPNKPMKMKVCPADLNPDANARGCAYHNGGKCIRDTYPFSCRLGLSSKEWEKLPIVQP